MKRILTLGVAAMTALCAGAALAKLPAPSEEAKAKAAEAAAKTAYDGKVASFQLCKSMDRVAASYRERAKKAGKPVTPTETPACADPGPFVYTPPPPASAPAVATAAATPAKK